MAAPMDRPLEDSIVRLEPLRAGHAKGIAEAASGSRDTYGYTSVPMPETAGDWVAETIARPEFWPFAQVDAASGRVVGHTAYLTPRWWADGRLLAIEIGATWLHPSAQGTGINSAAKALLLRNAFEALGVERVDIKTDARNARARAGIIAIGATFEGVLRRWQPSGAPGEVTRARDTAMFSITSDEWPAVRDRLAVRVRAKTRGATTAF